LTKIHSLNVRRDVKSRKSLTFGVQGHRCWTNIVGTSEKKRGRILACDKNKAGLCTVPQSTDSGLAVPSHETPAK